MCACRQHALSATGTLAVFRRGNGNSTTPVIPIVVGPDELAFQMARRLDDEGVFANAVVSPGSPPGPRAHPHLVHGHAHEAHLTRALEAFRKVGRELGLVS